MVGLGWWGRVMIEACGANAGLRFVHGVKRTPDGAVELAEKYGIRVSTSIDDVLADDAVEVVVLATPHSVHVDQIVACAQAGKDVFSEKPLALNLVDAQRAVDACASAGVVLGLGTDKRFLPAVKALSDLVASKRLGTILHIEAQYSNDNSLKGVLGTWRASEAEAPGGGMTGPGLHALDALVALGGPVATVRARMLEHTSSPAAVDSAAVLLTMASGATGAVTTVRGVPDFFRIQALGTKGWAEVRNFDTLEVALLEGARATKTYSAELAVAFLLDEFAAAVRGDHPFPVTTESMLATVAAFEATITSVDEDRTVAVAPTGASL